MLRYSFIICVYKKDNPLYLTESIDSMISQTSFPDEIVLVEDGPLTDDLYAVINKYCEKYPGLFTIVQNPVNIGLGKSLNVAISHARNELLARMDADDICYPERCELQLKAFEEHPEVVMVGTATKSFINEVSNIVSQSSPPLTKEEIYKRGQKRVSFAHVTVMYKKSVIQEFGCYGDYRRAQDLDLFCRMIYAGCDLMNLPQPLVYVRKDGISKRKQSKENINCVLAIRKKQYQTGYITGFQYRKMWCTYKLSALIPNCLYGKLYFLTKKKKQKQNKQKQKMKGKNNNETV